MRRSFSPKTSEAKNLSKKSADEGGEKLTRIPQSKSKIPEARWNPGAAKASDCGVSQPCCALVRRGDEVKHSLEAPLMSARRQKPIDFAAEGLRLAFSVNRNCAESGIKPAWT